MKQGHRVLAVALCLVACAAWVLVAGPIDWSVASWMEDPMSKTPPTEGDRVAPVRAGPLVPEGKGGAEPVAEIRVTVRGIMREQRVSVYLSASGAWEPVATVNVSPKEPSAGVQVPFPGSALVQSIWGREALEIVDPITYHVVFDARNSGMVLGRVISGQGAPISQASVVAYDAEFGVEEGETTTTGEDGEFCLYVRDRELLVVAVKGGWACSGPARWRGRRVTVTMEEGAPVRGHVYDTVGRPVENCVVYWWRSSTGSWSVPKLLTTTDASGRFEAGVAATENESAEGWMIASHPSWGLHYEAMKWRDITNKELHIKLLPRTFVTGYVVGANFWDKHGRRVHLGSVPLLGRDRRDVWADEGTGYFKVNGLGLGHPYEILLTDEAGQHLSGARVVGGESGVRLLLQRPGAREKVTFLGYVSSAWGQNLTVAWRLGHEEWTSAVSSERLVRGVVDTSVVKATLLRGREQIATCVVNRADVRDGETLQLFDGQGKSGVLTAKLGDGVRDGWDLRLENAAGLLCVAKGMNGASRIAVPQGDVVATLLWGGKVEVARAALRVAEGKTTEWVPTGIASLELGPTLESGTLLVRCEGVTVSLRARSTPVVMIVPRRDVMMSLVTPSEIWSAALRVDGARRVDLTPAGQQGGREVVFVSTLSLGVVRCRNTETGETSSVLMEAGDHEIVGRARLGRGASYDMLGEDWEILGVLAIPKDGDGLLRVQLGPH